MPLLTRVRESYRRQALQPGWHFIGADRPKDEIAKEIRQRVG
jgi:hypothetical protein